MQLLPGEEEGREGLLPAPNCLLIMGINFVCEVLVPNSTLLSA